jgi:DNA mismatch repair protein MutL
MSIKKLPKNIINILSAWEVVERPYSVVKELVENAIDAKANEIILEVENWWKRLVKVKDNWIGISQEDLPLTVEEYATSKISSIEDIYHLSSFCFRGEALSTISEVSKFTIKTKQAQSPIGYQLKKYEWKVQIEPVSVNFDHWTEVIVQDLFYNVPVRRKFLKSDQTEFKYIQELFIDFSTKYWNISFKLFNNWKLVKDFQKANSLFDRIFQIYPSSWKENILVLEHNDSIYQVNWLIWKSILKFTSSNNIKIFVNWRPIKDKIIQKAIMQAYSRWLEPGMYPFAILFLDIKPDLVDVNVHPRKEEVKFIDPGSVYNLVLNLIKWKIEEEKWIETKTNYVDFSSYKKAQNFKSGKIDWWKIKQISDSKLELDFTQNIVNETSNLKEGNSDIKIIWQIFDSYILFSKWEDFYIMDQHAVAERIIFEKMRNEYDPGNISLLSVPLTFEIKEKIDERLKQIQNLGFDIDYFWQNKVIVYAVPAILEKYKVDISALINSLLYSNDNIDISYMLEQILATKSCKAAIKANHKLSFEEMKQLIEDGMKYINGFFVCQHGRPSVVKLSKQDIDSFFDRT